MSRPKTQRPSRSVLLWTLYVILVLTAAVALTRLLIGGWLVNLGATVLLWRVIRMLLSLAAGRNQEYRPTTQHGTRTPAAQQSNPPCGRCAAR
jgi:hypothetical protein